MSEQPKEPSQWAKDAVVKQSFPLSIGDIARLIDAATAQRDAEIERLKAWKESAMSTSPDLQAIGREIGVPLGWSVHDKVLPWIQTARERIAQLEALLEQVPHNHHVPMPPSVIVSSDCPRCRYKALKKAPPVG